MDKKKKKGLFLAVMVLVIVIMVVLLLKNAGVFEKSDKKEEKVPEKVSEVVEADETISEGTASIEEVLGGASGYEDIYDQLAAYHEGMYSEDLFSDPEYDFLGNGEEEADLYEYDMSDWISFTEVQEHMEEGDVCKTEGDCAYLVRNDNSVQIMQLNGSLMEHKGLISGYQHELETVMELYLCGNQLVLLTTYTEIVDEAAGLYNEGTLIYTYDVTNKEAPVLLGAIEVEGFYQGSFIADANVYVYTTCSKTGYADENGELISYDALDPASYVPSVNGSVLSAENVHMAKKIYDSSYLVCASVDLNTPDQVTDAKAFLSVDAQCYTGEEAVYVLYRNGLYNVKNTVLVKIALTDGQICPTAGYIVDGKVTGTSVMYEQEGQFYVIASADTEDSTRNNLYILDDTMNLTGKKEDLTGDREIQSVRYIGKRVYLAAEGEEPIVTVNMEDPANISVYTMAQPEQFSDMLYPFGEDQILSVSSRFNQETGMYEQIDMTMYDISDPAHIVVLYKEKISADSTPAVGNIDGLYIDTEKGLIGFPTEDWDEGYTNVENYYCLYSYTSETGFQNVLEARLGAGSCWYARGFVSGEAFYVAEQDTGNIRSYDMANGYEQTGEMYY